MLGINYFVNFLLAPLVIGLVIFFLIRPILHWYWKIDEMSSDLKAIRQVLVKTPHFELPLEMTPDESKSYLESDAETGDKEAQFQLGKKFDDLGDEKKAFIWFKRAADQGHSTAQFNVGDMYLDGEGVERNMDEGHRWLTL